MAYYLYKNSPKTWWAQGIWKHIWKKLQKPSKSTGTRWTAHKVRAMEITLANYSNFMAHIESLSQTDSQAEKQAEFEGLAKNGCKENILCI